jgi:hypothetical protein
MSTVTHYIATFQTRGIALNELRVIGFPSRTVDPVSGVDRHSGVFATVTEVFPSQSSALDVPEIGAASISVRNIAPQDSGDVNIWLAVSPLFPHLNVRIQFLVCND